MNIIYLETCKERNRHGWQSDMDHSCSRPPARWHGIQPHLLRERKSSDVPITRPNSPQIQHPGPASPSVINSGNTCVVRLRRLASWRPRCVISCRSFRLRPCRICKVTWCLHRGPEHPRVLLVRVLAHVGSVSGVGIFWKEIGAAHMATQPFVCLAAECLC